MKEYVYDGSFQGMLTALSLALEEEGEVRIWNREEFRPSLFAKPLEVKTSAVESFKFKKKLVCNYPEPLYRTVLHSFLSEEKSSANLILDFLIRRGKGEVALGHRVRELEKRVSVEKVRLLGFIRFQGVEQGYFYAPVQPINNVLGLLAPHFASRQKGHDWVIHDVKREIAAVGKGRNWEIRALPKLKPPLSSEEKTVQNLWKEHFTSLAVPGRINRKRQNSLIPRRYWPHLTEKS